MEAVTGAEVMAIVTELLDKFIVGVGCLVNVGNVTFSIDEFNCDELITVTEVVIRTREVLDKRLVEETSDVVLEDLVNKGVPVIVELFTWGVEGTSVVTFDKDAVILLVLIDGMIVELKTIVSDLFGDDTMLELFLSLVVVGSDKLDITVTGEGTPVVAVLVINVEFSDGLVAEDNVLLKICVVLLDITAVELFTVKVCVKIGELKIEDGEKVVALLLKLATLDDWITVIVNN